MATSPNGQTPQGQLERKSTGPLTGHAAASLNPDGSTQIRLLDQGADPGVEVNKGTGKTKEPDPGQYQIQSIDPTTANTDRLIGEEEPTTVAGKIFHGLGELWDKAPKGIAEALEETPGAVVEALSDTKDALTSEEMKKGVEFGVRAALEVMKEAGKKAGKDGLYAWALSKVLPDDDIALNLAASLGLLTKEGLRDYHGDFKKLGIRVGKNILEIKQDVYGDKKP